MVPESQLKKQKTQQRIAEERSVKLVAFRKALRQKRIEAARNAVKYAKEYNSTERALIRFRRQSRVTGNFFVEPESKLAFVIRIKGINKVDPKTKKILQLLRLRQIHNGVFLRLNKSTLKMLTLVEPYIAWGYPNQKSVRDLIYKRGYGKISHARIPLTDNRLIDESLGKYKISCIEDLVHEVFTVGAHFKEATNFLWPFKLNTPNGGFNKKSIHFITGGDHGNREDHINALLRRMI
eukprot:TRINITY_DN1023_c0_g1::TRINITY_DN1023_c0_g1_i1::g.29983::m.29983 TRINITY_DN1023_c0_g1::TRINITY_DN1023_c0_g1_i1::g.29983  ORF type:complete len:254 (+),score=72.05,sp/P60039/RL73_ARATH/57.56/2e-97,Ribosomal_L30/PF00327.15/2.4e-20,Ribosomal_L30_N/PF08079.7/1.7e-14 TRINITY_DN1023_c0_g1_i1:54-764(+)